MDLAASSASALIARMSQDTLPQRSAAGLASVLTTALQNMLTEAETYAALFESRIKHEENFIQSLRHGIEKQNEVDGKAELKLAAPYHALFSAGSATLRATWREFRDNQTREIEMRQSLVDALRAHVIAPLHSFRESQERIRRRVKEDLKVSLSDYDQMREHTLPRLRKTYEKKCEQLEQLRGQQQAIDDQRILLSQANSAPQVPTVGNLNLSNFGPNTGEADDSPVVPGAAPMSQTNSQSSAPEMNRTYGSNGSPSTDGGGPTFAQNRSDLNLSTLPSFPPQNPEKGKLSLREVLRTKEGREAAIKDAPKKLQTFINRMREGGSGSPGGLSRDRDGSDSSATSGTLVGTGPFENTTSGLVRGSSAAKSIQNIALRAVQVKKESEDADHAYRKAVFDLETLRIRRSKTLAAAVSSVIECRRELNRTAQMALLQAERAALSTAHSAVSVHDRTEEIVERAIAPMANEAAELESGLAAVMHEDEGPVPYFNYWHGRAQVIFGLSLTDYAFGHQRGRVVQPPTIVMKCIAYIEAHGLEQQGLYRISARHSAIQALVAAAEKDEEGLDFEALKPDVPAVAGLLKLYLRELPEPVMSMPWEERIKYTHEREEHIRNGLSALKGRIRRLPPINNVTLKALIFHLANVAAHADKNSMNETNLAVIFGPVILSEADHETTSLAAAMEEDRVVEDLIRHAPQIFDAGPVDPNSTASTTTTMAHGATLLPHGPDGSPAIAIPAVPLSTSIQGLAAVSSVSDEPLLPGAAGLKRSNAIIPGETVSPPRRELHLHSSQASSGERHGMPSLPPVQTSPLVPLDLDPMEQAAAHAATTDSLQPLESPGLAAAEQYEPISSSAGADEDKESSLVSRSSTVRHPTSSSGAYQAPTEESAAPVDELAPGGIATSTGGEVASPIALSGHISVTSTSSAWADSSLRSGSTSSTSSSSAPLNPWADRARVASGESGPSPSSGSTSSGFSVPRPLPVPGMAPQAGQASHKAPVPGDAFAAPGSMEGSAVPGPLSEYSRLATQSPAVAISTRADPSAAPPPPPVSELIFTRPPPSSTGAITASNKPPLPPRPIPLNAPVSRGSGEIAVDALTSVELQRE